MLVFLVKNGADTNIVYNKRRTPLHIATAKFCLNFNVCEHLILNGCDVNAKDIDGKTVLHYVASTHILALAEIFVSHGADINAKDNENQTPLQIASKDEVSKDIAEYLMNLGKEHEHSSV
ncbi:ankyrin repeat protein, putative [Trichomonas vaginalis G3]|uniref:Ankyrin repeat protein, putative n=1 Tax=Trichomonas vaginalis (strain ATCC PRA-98 / G3) TaxID=412133 RepID=A2FC10_TRIV3|nr:fatty-acyl-CoA binding [Trichomonas vaginalis G3]EAX97556.1 ankyrin repeat protein, putative [Trichomonas vaginalis G3]KAI5488113.1 fatty-acyl-CoA binding [Trichomonas vaginalis G3]|eukprot:XP_001310486.1 ankyrin repeat protein [Trichomonas vaginalis G3]